MQGRNSFFLSAGSQKGVSPLHAATVVAARRPYLVVTYRPTQAIADKLELFDRFAALEDEFEPLEAALQDIVDAISAAGEVASDIARGA